ncbi:hypothetical protein CLD20_06860 [Afifella sp. IM 167]|nr:hypothetical protein [Afifella sp. IM 167]
MLPSRGPGSELRGILFREVTTESDHDRHALFSPQRSDGDRRQRHMVRRSLSDGTWQPVRDGVLDILFAI